MKTIKQIADEIGVSKQAIQQRMNKEPLSTSLKGLSTRVGGVIYIDIEGENLIKSAFIKKEPTSPTSENGNDLPTSTDNLSASKPTSIEDITQNYINGLLKQIDILTAEKTDLQEQLKQEREHSRQQAERLSELSEKLTELTRNSQILLKQEQDKTAFLLPDGEANANNADKAKVSLWSRIFKRKEGQD